MKTPKGRRRWIVGLLVALAPLLVLAVTEGAGQLRSAPEDNRAPSSPTGLATARATKSTVSITWRPARDNVAVAGYIVYRRALRVGRPRYTSFTLRDLECGRRHRIAVAAFDVARNRSRTASIVVATKPCAPSSDGTYYVSPSGSNLNRGTEEAPFRTIQKAADVVSPGDTVIVKPGVYTDEHECGAADALVCIHRGGTASAPVTFRALVPRAAKLDGRRAVPNGFVFYNNARYVRIQGFEIAHLVTEGTSSHGVDIYNGGANSWIVGNHIYDIGRTATDISNAQAGIFVEKNNVVIERNYIHDIGRTNDDWSHDHGVYVDGNDGPRRNVVIRNNVFAAITHGWSVHIYPNAVDGIKVLNNTFLGGNPMREFSHVVISDVSISNSSIRNNVFYGPAHGKAVRLRDSTYSDVLIADNLTSSVAIMTVEPPPGVRAVRNLLLSDPMFVNHRSRPYGLRLERESPGRNRGAKLALVRNDFNGTARPKETAHEIGAFEHTP